MRELFDFSSGTVFKNLALAAFLGALIVLSARAGTVKLLGLTEKTAVPSKPAPSAPAQADVSLEEIRLAKIAKQERVQKEQEALAAENTKREQKLQAALAARELSRAKAEKEAAWLRFYKKPKKCDNPNDNSLIVECGNHYLREQQRFEKLYADGKL